MSPSLNLRKREAAFAVTPRSSALWSFVVPSPMGGACEFRFPPYPSTPAEGGVLTAEERVAEDIRMAVYKMSRKKLEKMKQMVEEIQKAEEKKIASQKMDRENLEKMKQRVEETKKIEKEKKAAKQKMKSKKLEKMKLKAEVTKKSEKEKKLAHQKMEGEKLEKMEEMAEMENADKETANQKPARKQPVAYRFPLPPPAILWPVTQPCEISEGH